MNRLTICSVYHSSHSKNLLKINYNLTNKLNPQKNWVWIAADNTLTDLGKNSGLIIIPGSPQPTHVNPLYRGGYHHAESLNKICRMAKTRFLLVLDNDFFIVRNNWVNEVIKYMLKHNLSFFGAPWHPKWSNKYRYFPYAHCMFIDLNKIPVESIDFLPQNPKSKVKWGNDIQLNQPRTLINFIEPVVRNLIPNSAKKLLVKNYRAFSIITLRDRKFISKSRDTAYKLYRRYGIRKKYKTECLIPVLRKKDIEPYVRSGVNQFIERFLPENLCFVPKLRESYTNQGFEEMGFGKLTKYDLEEFMWYKQPFGFHLRGMMRLKNKHSTELLIVQKSIKKLTN